MSSSGKEFNGVIGPLMPNGEKGKEEKTSEPVSGDSEPVYSESDWASEGSSSSSSKLESIEKMMSDGADGRAILAQIAPDLHIPESAPSVTLWRLIVSLLNEPPVRHKLDTYNTFQDALTLIEKSKKILVLSGAGVSVSCGIPDFRSRNGIYARLHEEYPDLPNPEAMFDISYFRHNPKPFFQFARQIFPGQFKPSLAHQFIALLEKRGQLLRNYTQNIDCLETAAGVTRDLQCHGSFATATCCQCKRKVKCDEIRDAIMAQQIPKCDLCLSSYPTKSWPQHEGGEENGTSSRTNGDEKDDSEEFFPILKPDIVFFGESLSEEFHRQLAEDKHEVDLLIVIGSSMKVRPVSLIPASLPHHVPQILINNQPISHLNFDICLQGDCTLIFKEILHRLGWADQIGSLSAEGTPDSPYKPLKEITEVPKPPEVNTEDTQTPTAINGGHHSESDSPPPPKISKADETEGQLLVGNGPSTSSSGEAQESVDAGPGISNEALRKMFKPKLFNIATYLPERSYLFMPPSTYVFPGAEIVLDLDDDSSDSSSDGVPEGYSDEGSSSSEGSSGSETEHNIKAKELSDIGCVKDPSIGQALLNASALERQTTENVLQ